MAIAGESESENEQRRQAARAGAQILAGIAKDIRRLRIGFIG